MSNQEVTYVVIAACSVLALAAYVTFILVPAWTAYSRIWERMAAAVLTVYVVAAFVGIGAVGGAAIVWFWDSIGF